MARGNLIGSDLAGNHEKLIKLEVIIAQAAWDRRASRQILFNKGPHDVALETLFMVDDIVRNAKGFGDTSRIVNIVNRAAAPLHGLRHARVSSEAALVPELHRQSDEIVPFGAQHGRNG